MAAIIDPRSGALVKALRDKVQVDALVRVFTPLQSRILHPNFGTNLYQAINDAGPEQLAGLRARIIAALRDSPYYELVDVAILQDGESLEICLTLKLPDGSTQTLSVTS